MLDPAILSAALKKVQRRRHQMPNEREGYTADEVAALSAWMNLQLQFMGKETRTERRDRNRAAWNSGDRRQWGGERRRRDPRRGWRNFRESV